jgi:hypothetical protein
MDALEVGALARAALRVFWLIHVQNGAFNLCVTPSTRLRLITGSASESKPMKGINSGPLGAARSIDRPAAGRRIYDAVEVAGFSFNHTEGPLEGAGQLACDTDAMP